MVGMMKYKRVCQRIKEAHQDQDFPLEALENAIFIECGTDPRTVKSTIDRMIRMDFIEETNPIRVFGVMPTRKFRLKQAENDLF